jgi:hypothetical protein
MIRKLICVRWLHKLSGQEKDKRRRDRNWEKMRGELARTWMAKIWGRGKGSMGRGKGTEKREDFRFEI